MPPGETFDSQFALGILRLQQTLNQQDVETQLMQKQRERENFFKQQQLNTQQQNTDLDLERFKLQAKQDEERRTNAFNNRVQAVVNEGKITTFDEGDPLPDFSTLTVPGPGADGKVEQKPLEVKLIHQAGKIIVAPFNHPKANAEAQAHIDALAKTEAETTVLGAREQAQHAIALKESYEAAQLARKAPITPADMKFLQEGYDAVRQSAIKAKDSAELMDPGLRRQDRPWTSWVKAEDDKDILSRYRKMASAYTLQTEGRLRTFDDTSTPADHVKAAQAYLGRSAAGPAPTAAKPSAMSAGSAPSAETEATALLAEVKNRSTPAPRKAAIRQRLAQLKQENSK